MAAIYAYTANRVWCLSNVGDWCYDNVWPNICKRSPEHCPNLQDPTFDICLEKLLTMLFKHWKYIARNVIQNYLVLSSCFVAPLLGEPKLLRATAAFIEAMGRFVWVCRHHIFQSPFFRLISFLLFRILTIRTPNNLLLTMDNHQAHPAITLSYL